MIIDPIEMFNNITILSSSNIFNKSNYLCSLDYIDHAYDFLKVIKKIDISAEDVRFLPSFKDKKLAEDLDIVASAEETTMRVFKIQSYKLLEDENFNKFKTALMSTICDNVFISDGIVTCILKDEDEKI